MAAPKGRLVTPVAFDAGGYPRSLKVDALDRLKVVGGGFGYSDSLFIGISNISLPAGMSTVDADPVPVGWVWVVTHFSILYVGTVPNLIDVAIDSASEPCHIYRQMSPASGAVYDRQGWWVLNDGHIIKYRVWGATQGDKLYGWANGFKVQLTP